MHIEIKTFDQLEVQELYDILRLRSEVFVVEQDCVYQDVDNKDQQATHILGYDNDALVAYTRYFPPGFYFDQASIGRVVVDPAYRGKALGKKIMEASIAFAKANHIKSQDTSEVQLKISAQCYLDAFYKDLGFYTTGATYLEDGIPHQAMLLSLS